MLMNLSYGSRAGSGQYIIKLCLCFRFGKRGSDLKDLAAMFKHYRMLRELYGDE